MTIKRYAEMGKLFIGSLLIHYLIKMVPDSPFPIMALIFTIIASFFILMWGIYEVED